MQENSQFEKKSLLVVTTTNPDWDEITKDCISFANGLGGKLIIGIEDRDELPPLNQKVDDALLVKIRKKIENRAINLGIELYKREAENVRNTLRY